MEQRTQNRQAPIGREQAAEALSILKRYKAGKASLEKRIVANEQWWRLRHWAQMRTEGERESEPASAWLQNCIAGKHADAMDHYPAPSILPREEGDRRAAAALCAILPAVLEQNDYEQVYSDMWWYKLKNGTGVTGVFWNPEKNEGRGEIDVRQLDLLNLFWEPGVKDIQASAHFFSVELWDKAYLKRRYPALQCGGSGMDLTQYVYDDTLDTTDKIPVIDWYYKQRRGGRTVLQYAKLACGEVLYATENLPHMRERGFYDHGMYPFVFDTLFPEEGSPAGYGYVDICKSPQMQIDLLNQAILKNALMASRPRWFVRGDGSINEEEYADWSRDFVHYHGSGSPRESLSQVEVRTLPEIYVAILNSKIEELKETSGNRDFNQGGATRGVTAASAIAALQEAGSKLSRDMIKSAYRAYGRMCGLMIELIRQFYDAPRCFRITGEDGQDAFTSYSNRDIRERSGSELSESLPVFDVRVRASKAAAYSRISQNELAMSLFKNGFFAPGRARQALLALELMDFEGKEQVMRMLRENENAMQPPAPLAQGEAAGEGERALGGQEGALRTALRSKLTKENNEGLGGERL